MSKKYHIHTFGCQMNVHDSEKIAGILSGSGYEETGGTGDADLIVFNTCSIREKAEQKFFSELGRLKHAKKDNPELKIAVAGCIAQQMGETLFKRFPYLDYVFGPDNIDSVQNWVNNNSLSVSVSCQPSTVIEDNPDYHKKLLPVKREGGARAWVSIMYGCDNFCAYCVVPYTRGRERSRPVNDICTEVKTLAKQGIKEITLLGQNVNSYGKNLPDNTDFPGLLKTIHEIDGIQRIRFVTSHPRDFSSRLIEAIRDLPKICEHIHLPVQAGSDRILNLMNRRYTYKEYKDKIDILKNEVPGITITTDIIAGFPGETDEDFELTVRALEEIEYDGIFAFKYSKRPGTKALDLPCHIDESIKSERLAIILNLQEKITYEKNRRLDGEIVEILVEGTSGSDADRLTGRTRSNKIVNFQGDEKDIGKLIRLKIVKAGMHSLYGEKIFEHSNV